MHIIIPLTQPSRVCRFSIDSLQHIVYTCRYNPFDQITSISPNEKCQLVPTLSGKHIIVFQLLDKLSLNVLSLITEFTPFWRPAGSCRAGGATQRAGRCKPGVPRPLWSVPCGWGISWGLWHSSPLATCPYCHTRWARAPVTGHSGQQPMTLIRVSFLSGNYLQYNYVCACVVGFPRRTPGDRNINSASFWWVRIW